MRLKLIFKLENNKIDFQYRKGIISWIKHALQEYNKDLYKEIYQGNNKKTFTFATILSKPKFENQEITLENNQFFNCFLSI